MAWILTCPNCEATCLDTDENHVCYSCHKVMLKTKKVDDDYVKDMSNRTYWVKRKQLETAYAHGQITKRQYEKERKFIEKHLHVHKGGENLLIAIDRPLIVPQASRKFIA